MANIAAAKIDSMKLREQSREQNNVREHLEHEMRTAADIQRSILPKVPPMLPGCDLFGESWSCEAVGGDYHDFVWDGRELLLIVADVAGKGLGAAMLMTALRAAVRAHWREPSLAAAAAMINRTFLENVPDDRYATCFIARFDPRTGRLTYVNAGHPPALLVRASGTTENLAEGGTGIGVFDDASFTMGSKTFAPGDTLLAYSDGVSESWSSQREAELSLIDLVNGARAAPVAAIHRAVLEATDRQRGGACNDDRTLIALRWYPT